MLWTLLLIEIKKSNFTFLLANRSGLFRIFYSRLNMLSSYEIARVYLQRLKP